MEAPAAGLGAEAEVWSTLLTWAAALVPPRDQFGRTPSEQRDDYTWLLKTRPTFKRGRDRFTHAKEVLQVPDEEAKWALWLAIEGPASRLVKAGLDPGTKTCSQDTYSQYLSRLEERFAPAAEGAGAVEEYLGGRQGRLEDIQSYVNAKHELFLRAYLAAQPRELEVFFQNALRE